VHVVFNPASNDFNTESLAFNFLESFIDSGLTVTLCLPFRHRSLCMCCAFCLSKYCRLLAHGSLTQRPLRIGTRFRYSIAGPLPLYHLARPSGNVVSTCQNVCYKLAQQIGDMGFLPRCFSVYKTSIFSDCSKTFACLQP
jgi:hypothetical protein